MQNSDDSLYSKIRYYVTERVDIMNDDENRIRLSVRNLVEFIFRSGNLSSTFTSNVRAVQGTKVHRKLQKQYESKATCDENILNYECEVFLKEEVIYKDFEFIVEGRADGIIVEKGCTVIDEIKSTAVPLENIYENYNPLHMKQAQCYAYMYALQNGLKSIYVQLTYYNIKNDNTKFIKKKFDFGELEKFFLGAIHSYYKWAKFSKNWIYIRNSSIESLKFPFGVYRPGQRKMAETVYNTIKAGKRLFIQAPTGIGKTISTIFPALKAMQLGLMTKMFYLTSKNINGAAAEQTVSMMEEQGLRLKTLVLTSKEKLCFQEKVDCNPEECKFAKGHYDRVNDAIFDIIRENDLLDTETILEFSRRFLVCPFEFSLDIALMCDLVICDYNYAFDPLVYLRRFFDETSESYVFLVDEAHNLVDRSRDMFSSEIHKKQFMDVKKIVEKDSKLKKTLNSANSYMIKLKNKAEIESNYFVVENKLMELDKVCRNVSYCMEDWIIKNHEDSRYDEVLDFYFSLNSFIKIYEFYSENFVTYIKAVKGDLIVRILCLDPSNLLDEAMERAKASILFSATLSPMRYYKDILGGSGEDYNITLGSPFDPENRKILISSRINTVYKFREESIDPISEYIMEAVSCRMGNYIVFFPSYNYMNNVYDTFIEKYHNIKTAVQKPDMNFDEKRDFMDNFNYSGGTFIGFAVLGGMFSEGIDLKGDKLIGTIIIGVGIPKLCIERNIIKKYFDDKNGCGYEYAYTYPGMNKVLQSGGRVIRTKDDKGIILLLDRRFLTSQYRRLFPQDWQKSSVVNSKEDLKCQLEIFWNKY